MLKPKQALGAVIVGLVMSSDSEAKPASPVSFAEIHVAASDGEVSVVLAGGPALAGKALGPDPSVHFDPISTMLEPHLAKGPGRVAQLTGYRLSSVHDPGDTVVTYALLLEVPPTGVGAVQAIWWENHQEIPTRLFTGTGRLAEAHGGGQMLVLTVTGDDGAVLTLDGTVRIK